MPSKYVLRSFRENAYYHVFNQGVEKRDIFLTEDDYYLFQRYLLIYLSPIEKVLEIDPDIPLRLTSRNLAGEIEILAYCLMPDHFHLFLKQKTKDAVPRLLKQLTNAYTFYFNQKYDRIGGLMQGRYKAVEVPDDNTFIHLARYIHLNPVVSSTHRSLGEGGPTLEDHRWSSYHYYLGHEADPPVAKDKILSYFPSVGAFKGFHEDQADYVNNLEKIKHLAIDE